MQRTGKFIAHYRKFRFPKFMFKKIFFSVLELQASPIFFAILWKLELWIWENAETAAVFALSHKILCF